MGSHKPEDAENESAGESRRRNESEISRRTFLRNSAAAAVGIAAAGKFVDSATLSSLSRLASAAPQTSAKDTLIAAWEAEMSSLEITKPLGVHDWRFHIQVTETLWRLEPGSANIRPALATNWRVSPDGKEWTATIRPGVRFHDGTPLTAQDVVWSFERWFDPKHPYHDPPYPQLTYDLGALERVEAIDARTVRFRLKRVDAVFEANMVVSPAGIVSPTAVQKLGKKGFAVKPVGTGAWRVDRWDKGTRLILERNNDYWGKKPILRRLIIRPVPEEALRLAQLKAGQVDVVPALPAQFIKNVEEDPNLKLLRSPGAHIWWIALNVREKPLNDRRVRQALNYAVNKDAIIGGLLRGGAVATRGAIFANSWAEDPNIKPYAYDPRRARLLLAAAGASGGFTLRFWVPESGGGMIAPKDIAVLVQAQLRDVGVRVEIIPEEWTSYVGQYGAQGFAPKGKPAYHMGEMSWNPHVPDPALCLDATLKTESHPPTRFNAGFYSNPEVDRLLAQASSTVDQARRKSLYFRAQRLIYDDAPWIFMFSAQNLAATRKNVAGLQLNPCFWWMDFTDTYVQS
jgi:peptide/nickel transport system substrate-binding protein